MFEKISKAYEELKLRIVETVEWAEKELKGKPGEEKRKAVIRKLDDLIVLPFYLEWADDWIIGYLVDLAVEKLNWLTGWKFAVSEAKIDNKKVAAVLEAPINNMNPQDGQTVDERLEALYQQYGIKAEAASVNQTKSAAPAQPDGWEPAIQFVLKWEGGYVDHPLDKGGETNMGITLPVLKTAYAQGIIGHCDPKKLTKDEAKRIYKKNYWERYGWGGLPLPVCICCLDISVNHGPSGMARIIQRACGKLGRSVEVDGKYGPKTKEALWELAKREPKGMAMAICDMRMDYYERIVAANPTQRVFMKGWTNRVNDLRRVCVG